MMKKVGTRYKTEFRIKLCSALGSFCHFDILSHNPGKISSSLSWAWVRLCASGPDELTSHVGESHSLTTNIRIDAFLETEGENYPELKVTYMIHGWKARVLL